ncbi:MAG: hypothetical protein IBX64_02215 [Actinobacteria bacterium]|nr:hypothetical protein [Actinomycetota bacterium]
MAYPSLVSALQGVQFPIDKNSLINQIGDREVEVLEGQTVSMRELLNACPKNRYETLHDVIACPEIVSMIEQTKAA